MVRELILLCNEWCRLENKKMSVLNDLYITLLRFLYWLMFSFFFQCSSLEGSVIQISDQGLLKVLYQKVVYFFYNKELPTHWDVCCVIDLGWAEGWMSSVQISRDGAFSLFKLVSSLLLLIFEWIVCAIKKRKTRKRRDGTRD